MSELNTFFTEEELRYIEMGLSAGSDYAEDSGDYKIVQIINSVITAVEREQKRLKEVRLNAQQTVEPNDTS